MEVAGYRTNEIYVAGYGVYQELTAFTYSGQEATRAGRSETHKESEQRDQT